jgi:hypothetical protein
MSYKRARLIEEFEEASRDSRRLCANTSYEVLTTNDVIKLAKRMENAVDNTMHVRDGGIGEEIYMLDIQPKEMDVDMTRLNDFEKCVFYCICSFMKENKIEAYDFHLNPLLVDEVLSYTEEPSISILLSTFAFRTKITAMHMIRILQEILAKDMYDDYPLTLFPFIDACDWLDSAHVRFMDRLVESLLQAARNAEDKYLDRILDIIRMLTNKYPPMPMDEIAVTPEEKKRIAVDWLRTELHKNHITL